MSGTIGVDASAHLTEELVKLEEAAGRVARLEGKAILEDASHQLAELGVTAVATIQRHGSLVETLDEIGAGYDLVVIGERGEHAETAKAHLGSNLERVVRAASRPLLVVERVYRPVQSFMIAYDGGPSVTRAMEFILGSPLLEGASCHILRAGHVDKEGKLRLEEAADKLRSGGYAVTSHAIAGAPERVISEALQRENVDLLVMGAHGHSPIRQFILGSTTTAMVRTSPVSILMFR